MGWNRFNGRAIYEDEVELEQAADAYDGFYATPNGPAEPEYSEYDFDGVYHNARTEENISPTELEAKRFTNLCSEVFYNGVLPTDETDLNKIYDTYPFLRVSSPDDEGPRSNSWNSAGMAPSCRRHNSIGQEETTIALNTFTAKIPRVQLFNTNPDEDDDVDKMGATLVDFLEEVASVLPAAPPPRGGSIGKKRTERDSGPPKVNGATVFDQLEKQMVRMKRFRPGYLLEFVLPHLKKQIKERVQAEGPASHMANAYWASGASRRQFRRQGKNGEDGEDGEDGADGANGADGADGANGADGAVGPNGADGADGAVGPNGPKGDPGILGNHGNKGDKGDKGEIWSEANILTLLRKLPGRETTANKVKSDQKGFQTLDLSVSDSVFTAYKQAYQNTQVRTLLGHHHNQRNVTLVLETEGDIWMACGGQSSTLPAKTWLTRGADCRTRATNSANFVSLRDMAHTFFDKRPNPEQNYVPYIGNNDTFTSQLFNLGYTQEQYLELDIEFRKFKRDHKQKMAFDVVDVLVEGGYSMVEGIGVHLAADILVAVSILCGLVINPETALEEMVFKDLQNPTRIERGIQLQLYSLDDPKIHSIANFFRNGKESLLKEFAQNSTKSVGGTEATIITDPEYRRWFIKLCRANDETNQINRSKLSSDRAVRMTEQEQTKRDVLYFFKRENGTAPPISSMFLP
jgi:hypothetical protein